MDWGGPASLDPIMLIKASADKRTMTKAPASGMAEWPWNRRARGRMVLFPRVRFQEAFISEGFSCGRLGP